MKKSAFILFLFLLFIFSMCACGESVDLTTTEAAPETTYSSSYGGSYDYDSYDSDSYKSTYKSSATGAGGYDMPNENDDSFADYVKRVDPDLYEDMNDIYDSLY